MEEPMRASRSACVREAKHFLQTEQMWEYSDIFAVLRYIFTKYAGNGCIRGAGVV